MNSSPAPLVIDRSTLEFDGGFSGFLVTPMKSLDFGAYLVREDESASSGRSPQVDARFPSRLSISSTFHAHSGCPGIMHGYSAGSLLLYSLNTLTKA